MSKRCFTIRFLTWMLLLSWLVLTKNDIWWLFGFGLTLKKQSKMKLPDDLKLLFLHRFVAKQWRFKLTVWTGQDLYDPRTFCNWFPIDDEMVKLLKMVMMKPWILIFLKLDQIFKKSYYKYLRISKEKTKFWSSWMHMCVYISQDTTKKVRRIPLWPYRGFLYLCINWILPSV